MPLIVIFVFRMIGWGGHFFTAFSMDNGRDSRMNKKRNQGGNCRNGRNWETKARQKISKNTQAKTAKT